MLLCLCLAGDNIIVSQSCCLSCSLRLPLSQPYPQVWWHRREELLQNDGIQNIIPGGPVLQPLTGQVLEPGHQFTGSLSISQLCLAESLSVGFAVDIVSPQHRILEGAVMCRLCCTQGSISELRFPRQQGRQNIGPLVLWSSPSLHHPLEDCEEGFDILSVSQLL